VTHRTRALLSAAAAALVVTPLAACSASEPGQAAPQPPDIRSTTASAAPAAPEKSAGHAEGLETPASRSGPLTRRDFPRPGRLGAGWAYSVDAGDVEEGYLGNGTPVLERDPVEVARLAVPFGCPRSATLPTPQHALEVDYTADDTKVIAIRASFPDSRTAAGFHDTRRAMLEDCRGRSASSAEGVLVGEVRGIGPHGVLSDRTPESAPWAELGLVDGDQVVLVAAQARLDRPPMTPAGARALVQAFRR
jgi:hypothetical protein